MTDDYNPYEDPDIGAALCHQAQQAAETAEKFREMSTRIRAFAEEFTALASTSLMDPEQHIEAWPDLLRGPAAAYMRMTIAEHFDRAALTFLSYAGAWDAEGERYAAAILETKAEPS